MFNLESFSRFHYLNFITWINDFITWRRWIDKFCFIRLILEWSKKDCIINSIPWSVITSNMGGLFSWCIFHNIYIMFVNSFRWFPTLNDCFISLFNNNFIAAEMIFICENFFLSYFVIYLIFFGWIFAKNIS